jgi:hypothetical protein
MPAFYNVCFFNTKITRSIIIFDHILNIIKKTCWHVWGLPATKHHLSQWHLKDIDSSSVMERWMRQKNLWFDASNYFFPYSLSLHLELVYFIFFFLSLNLCFLSLILLYLFNWKLSFIFFIYLLYIRFFTNFENYLGFLEFFYLLFFIEFTLANQH